MRYHIKLYQVINFKLILKLNHIHFKLSNQNNSVR